MPTKKKVIKPVKKVTTKLLAKKATVKVLKPVKKIIVVRKHVAKPTTKSVAKPIRKTIAKVSVSKKVVSKKTTPKPVPAKKKIITKTTKPTPKTPVKKITAKPIVKKASKKTPIKTAKTVKTIKVVSKAAQKLPVKVVKVSPKPVSKSLVKVPVKPAPKPVKAAHAKVPAKKQAIAPALLPKLNQNLPKRTVNEGGKRRLIVSYKNLTQEQIDVWREKYPRGYSDYMSDIMRFDKPDNSFFYYVILDMEDTTLLVKVDVKVDSDYEEVEKEIFGGGPDNTNNDNDEFPDTGDENSEFSDDADSEEEE